MEVAGLVFGVLPAVLQLYQVAEAAYDFYHDVKDFRSSYHELFLCLEIERFRFKRWGDHTLSESHLEEAKAHPSEMKLFELFDTILKRVCDTFSDSAQRMSAYSESTPGGTESRGNTILNTDNPTGDYSLQRSYRTWPSSLICRRGLAGSREPTPFAQTT